MPDKRSPRSLIFAAAAVVLALAILGLAFELGRYQAGFSLFDQRVRLDALSAVIADRDTEIDRLQRQQAILETSGDIDAETYSAVEAELSELQARIQGLEEELAFYRGIVSPGDGVAGLRIQTVELFQGSAVDRYALRLLLVQSIVHNDRVTGTVRLSVSGTIGAEETSLGLDELAAGSGETEIAYGFRYFQSIEQELELPANFMPSQIQIEIWPREPQGDTVTQVFPWAQLAGG